MRLVNLQAKFLRLLNSDGSSFTEDATFEECDGISFLCPKCLDETLTCWKPHVSRDIKPSPGRWVHGGSGIYDLSLIAAGGAPKLTGECGWRGWVGRNGVPPGEAR